MLFTRLDFAIDENGNLSTIDGDIARFSSVESVQKAIEWRLKTTKDEWYVNPYIVAGVLDFVGRKNDRDTGELMRTRIETAICSDNFVPRNNLIADVVPISREEVQIIIIVKDFYAPDLSEQIDLKLTYEFSYQEGLITSLTGGTR